MSKDMLCFDWLKDYVKDKMEQWKIPGTAICILKDGQVVFNEGFGLRNIKENLKITPNTLFSIASMTKSFTATALAKLVEEGKLEWDKPIRTYLPEFQMYDLYAEKHVTIRDMMCHRTGLPRHDFMWVGCNYSRKEIVEKIKYLEPTKDFRASYQYQNLMFVVAGYLIEKVTGKTWEEYVEENILKPLQMNNTNFSTNESVKCENYALPHILEKDKLVEIPFGNVDAVGPCGTMNSTIEDLAKWFEFHLNRGNFKGTQILSEIGIKEIHKPQVVINEGIIKFKETPQVSYGLGWTVQPYRGHNLIEHTGSIFGFGSLGAFMPDDNIAIIILSNCQSSTFFNAEIRNVIIDRILGLSEIKWHEKYREISEKLEQWMDKSTKLIYEEKKMGTIPSHELKDYVGEYIHPAYGVLTVKLEDNKLRVLHNYHNILLEHYHYDCFLWDMKKFDALPMIASFSTNKKGEINSISVPFEPTGKDIVFTRCK